MAFFMTLQDFYWCRLQELNPRPTDYKSVALPTELNRLFPKGIAAFSCQAFG